MTAQEAMTFAQNHIPEEADFVYAFDRDEHKFSSNRSGFIKRYYIGCGNHCYGNGNTWSEAVEALMLSSGKMKKAVRA